MYPTIIILADRISFPLRNCGERSLHHPATQLELHARQLPATARTMVLVGFKKEAVLAAHPHWIYLINPAPVVERTPSSIARCLAQIDAREDVFLLESDSYVEWQGLEAVFKRERSAVLKSPTLTRPEQKETSYFVKASDRAFLNGLLQEDWLGPEGLNKHVRPRFEEIETSQMPAALAARYATMAQRENNRHSLSFDQQ